jgi:hypothetical protein
MRCIYDGMMYIAIVHFAILRHDISILILSCFYLPSSRRVYLTMIRFSTHKFCILNQIERSETESKALPCSLPISILRPFRLRYLWNSGQTNISTPDSNMRSWNKQNIELLGILLGHTWYLNIKFCLPLQANTLTYSAK